MTLSKLQLEGKKLLKWRKQTKQKNAGRLIKIISACNKMENIEKIEKNYNKRQNM